jgi:hypothetical protein
MTYTILWIVALVLLFVAAGIGILCVGARAMREQDEDGDDL